MTKHLYLSLMPEALIASMLSPREFGLYYAVGSHRKLRGQAIFIELSLNFRSDYFRIDEGLERCEAHSDGSPKKSVYISTYRVLEHVPLNSIERLYLVTAYGEIMGIDVSNNLPDGEDSLHMYQEIAPVQPLVVSTRGPVEFSKFITSGPASMVHLPALAFSELRLDALATDPEHGVVDELPYEYIPHLRECLLELREKTIDIKMVDRVHAVEFPYRMIKSGVFLANRSDLAYFPLPSMDELRGKHYRWWRSANIG
jgi:hypothetical protein